MCVDLSRLNRYVQRERYQSPSPAEAVADITAEEAKYFIVIDAAKGYHQCPLDEQSQLYTLSLLRLAVLVFLWFSQPIIFQYGYCGTAPAPIAPLTEHKNDFLWSPVHDQSFGRVKEHLVEIPTLAYFDLKRQTRLCTDASRQGIGFVLQQLSDRGQWTLVQAGSRFLSSAESRYAVIELEFLAVAWSVRCFCRVCNISKLSPTITLWCQY